MNQKLSKSKMLIKMLPQVKLRYYNAKIIKLLLKIGVYRLITTLK